VGSSRDDANPERDGVVEVKSAEVMPDELAMAVVLVVVVVSTPDGLAAVVATPDGVAAVVVMAMAVWPRIEGPEEVSRGCLVMAGGQ
jgi:hypothetical protein